jgi:hypothetical protein
MDNTPSALITLPPGTKVTMFRGRILAACPSEPPFFIDIGWPKDGGEPMVVKVPIEWTPPAI